MSTVIVALALLAIALALIGSLTLLLARPLVAPTLTALERARFQRRANHVARADAHLRERQVDAALRELEGAFCLFTVRIDARLVEQIGRHHTGLLSRLLSVADDVPHHRVRLLSLAKVDRLLERRAEMQRAHLQLRARPVRDARRQQLGRELRRNARDTRAAVRELIADIQLISGRRVAVQ